MYFSKVLTVVVAALAMAVPQRGAAQARSYAPIDQYLMERGAEVALARSAAPAHIADAATVKVFTRSGYEVAERGTNGFVCLVLRSWGAPTYQPEPMIQLMYSAGLRAPICFDPVAAATIAPYQEFKAKLGLEGRTPAEIGPLVAQAYVLGQLPRLDGVAFAYMFSADQDLDGQGNRFMPHMMVYAPWYKNEDLGANPFGGTLPFVLDDPNTPFTVVTIPVVGNESVSASQAGGR